jgi:hypothetical protein
VQVRKLEGADGFVVVDLPGAPRSVGIVRLAPKVLVDGAEMLARSTTYAFATFGVQAGGVSAGINARPDDRDAAVTAFCETVAADVGSGAFHFTAGNGVDPEELAPLGCEPLDAGLAAQGAAAAASAFVGGGTAVVVGGGDWAGRVETWWKDAGGGEVVEGGFDADGDVLFVAGKAGVVDDDAAVKVRTRAIVPLTPVPVTAKAFATLGRAGVVYVPDTVSLAAPLLALVDPDGGDPVERVKAKAAELAPAGVDAWRRMIEQAETFLSTWQEQLPYGRPLSS